MRFLVGVFSGFELHNDYRAIPRVEIENMPVQWVNQVTFCFFFGGNTVCYRV